MIFRVETTSRFDKEFKKPDKYTQTLLKSWIEKNLINCQNPRQQGKALQGQLKGKWIYRIGDYRLICQIKDDELIILALTIGHRREIYKQ